MPIEIVKSTIFGTIGAGGYAAPNASARQGEFQRVAGRVTNGAAASNGSKYLLMELPWSAILLPQSAFRTDAWGFAQAVLGTDEATTGLLNAVKGASATGQLPVTIFGAKWNKPFWEQIGLAAMPKAGVAKLYAYAVADAAGAGTLDFDVQFVNHL